MTPAAAEAAGPGGAVRVEVRDRVAVATLDRPDARNALDEAVVGGLEQLVADVRADRSLRALVVTGAGDAFSIGMDLAVLGRAFDDPAYFRAFLERLNAVLIAVEELDLPVIAAVNGLTRAGGFELLLAADLVVVADEARIADDHVRFGVLPGGGASWRAPRKLGDQRARELLLTGRWLTGPEAAAAGLALRSVPLTELPAAVEALVGPLRRRSRAALGATKAAMRRAEGLPARAAVAAEIDVFAEHLGHPDAREGFDAYRAGRDPVWRD